MQHVERLAQETAVDHEGDICFGGTLGTGNHADARASQRAEQLAGDAGCLLHVLTHDGDGGQTAFHLHGEHGTRLNLLGKLIVQCLCCCLGILVTHTDRSGVLR